MLLLPKATKRKLEDFTLMSYLVMPLLFSMHFGFKLKFLTDWVYYYIYYPKKIILSCFFFKRRKRDAFNLLKGNNTLHLAYRTYSLKYKYLFILIFASSHYSSPKIYRHLLVWAFPTFTQLDDPPYCYFRGCFVNKPNSFCITSISLKRSNPYLKFAEICLIMFKRFWEKA